MRAWVLVLLAGGLALGVQAAPAPYRRSDASTVDLKKLRRTEAVFAVLYAPQPHPERRGALVMTRKAEPHGPGRLASDPVSLEWAPRKGGPWHFINRPRLANTGRCTWRVAPAAPRRVYLRL